MKRRVKNLKQIKPSDLIIRNELHFEHQKGVQGVGAHKNKKKIIHRKRKYKEELK